MENKLRELSVAYNYLINMLRKANKAGAFEIEESHQIVEVEKSLSQILQDMAQTLSRPSVEPDPTEDMPDKKSGRKRN